MLAADGTFCAKPPEVRQTADLVQFAGDLQCFGNGDHINRLGLLAQPRDLAEDQAMLLAIEIVVVHQVGDLVQRARFQ